MKIFLLLYLSLFSLIYLASALDDKIATLFLFAFIGFQFVISLGTFLLDDSDLKELHDKNKKIPLILTLLIDLLFIEMLFYTSFFIPACLWFTQSFLINNTLTKAEILYGNQK